MNKLNKQLTFLLFLLLFLFSSPGYSSPEHGETGMKQANQSYQQGNYRDAISGYERLLADGYRSTALFYNLGNSYYRAGDLGRAVLNYERARLLAPGDRDINHNLQVARNRLPEELTPLPAFFLARWWAGLRGWLSPDAWGVVSLILLWSGLGGLIFWQLGKTRPQRKWGFIAGAGLMLFSVLPFALGWSARSQWLDSKSAIILAESSSLRSAPDPESKAVMDLPAGLTVDLMDRIRDWHQVRLPNGEEGWVQEKDLEKI